MVEKVWKPFKRQEDFSSIPDTVFEALYGGAAGGGKSEILLLLPIIRGFYKHPRFKGIIFRRTYPELEKEIIIRSHEYYPPCGGSYSDEKKRWTFKPQGSIIQFGHLEYESDVRKYDTAEYNLMAFDELTSFTEYMYLYLVMSRIRTSTPKLPTIVRSATNPGNVGHGWVRKRFVEPAPYGTIALDKTTGLKRIFIQSLATDNPHIDPGYVQRLSGLPEAERRAKRDGDWWTFSGQVFDDWREQPMPDEPPNACHVIPDFPIPDWWPRVLAIDWGYTAMTCALWAAISPDNRIYIYREYTAAKTKISTWAADIGRLSQNEKLNDVVMCQSAWQNRGDARNIAEQFADHSGLRPRIADNERVSGKVDVQEALRWRGKPSRMTPSEGYNAVTAVEILRKFGSSEYQKYLNSFEPEKPETNLPVVQVFTQCPVLRRTIPLCVYNSATEGRAKNKEDVAEFDGDDAYDTFRYLIKACNALMGKSQNEHEERVKLGQAINELQQSNNWTRFHRQIEHLERNTSKVHSTRRFHRARLAH
jgi:hypothetical protein